MKPRTYAVVDIETTGTNPKEDRIIQFGCVMIESGRITSRFSIDIHPGRKISKQIQHLTGITNQRVQKAPYFEDVAQTIYNLLADTIFVAHNIYFDYNFLNHELMRCGLPSLKIPGIDTVELAQIFLPTEPSFRLADLSESLGFIHENPHQADSDAEVTGQLLLLIEERMRKLPIITLEQIARLSRHTGMDTSRFIYHVIEEMKEKPEPLDPSLEIVDGLALQKKEVELFTSVHYGERTYPRKKQAKEKMFGKTLMYRKEQNRLMNAVYDHFTKDESKDLMIEAATGMGKTIGYLLPLSYLATPEKPAVISTVSLVLQQQIIEKDIPLLNQLLDQPIQPVIIKSYRHYIDLQRFKGTLVEPPEQKQYALYQMAVLVWLTQTKTGDLDELHLTNLNHAFFADIAHRGTGFLARNQSFYEQDFVRFLQKKIRQSNFLIVNHAFLVQETQRKEPLLPASPFLLIDEVHHLPEIAEKVNDKRLSINYFHKQIQQLEEPNQLFDRIQSYLPKEHEALRWLSIYREELSALCEAQICMAEGLMSLVSGKQPNGQYPEEVMMTKEMLDQLPLESGTAIDHLQLFYQEIQQLQSQMRLTFEIIQESWTNQMRIDLASLYSLFDQLDKQYLLMDQWLEDWRDHLIHWFVPGNTAQQMIFHLHDFQAAMLPSTVWYPRYDRILYIGGTLKIGPNRHYLSKRLGIEAAPLKVIASPYDYEKQARIYVPKEAPAVHQVSNQAYIDYLETALTGLIEQEDRPILVLFTSHDVLQKVYQKMHLSMLEKGREILAQGFGGSREKLLKRFILSEKSVLFGADSFWEGVDLPGDALQIVVVTRLPFDNPLRPMVKARNAYLESEGINPFYQESVPKATLKLRQALGRLIRTETDRGVLLILDRRLVTAKYGARIIHALPKKVPIKELAMEEIYQDIHEFLKKNEEGS
ncbi:exonuclease, DNA polymerase III, epsilon subunit [Enterococcus faecium]|uniref:helicase C-terminal domain-containing protein n=1 Tax=Enterococcus faecium TaxID=1352 RepID=UPI00190EA9A4|nr:helicase C-terminal domain-containing protein [Enterococcus faecium]MBK4749218.1 exonuclease, DNA polymerase III, epsilon subunit [Enterococcus faecium]MBK4754429.1 exonuclease, DNA polymerase III, epsilon subunit [Enterococcus faecium]MBK4760245.1 exonuclease, DNA polymerase III, epsilon subunit [Enterococcus faecium]MBK4792173.1 exonuclease, DNA polymerase III, epsilon subunit [Enterococcus faecium]MBK4794812.1 exonuclease, DNA polymerase III, epsilon subunit [Enterococcus faecium]